MEIIILIGVVWFVIWLVGHINSGSGKESGYAGRGYEQKPMKEFELRIKNEMIGEPGHRLPVKHIEVKGLFPVSTKKNVKFVVSVLDKDEAGTLRPVLSALEDFQEEGSICFQCVRNVPEMKPGYGFPDWVSVGVIFPDLIVAPYSGKRNLIIILRLIDSGLPLRIENGFHDAEDPAIVWQKSKTIPCTLKEKGYVEEKQNQREAQLLTLKLAVAVAVSDGHAHSEEAALIKAWIARRLLHVQESDREEEKKAFNRAVRDSFERSRNGELDLGDICQRFNELGIAGAKYEALELCHDVMAADGIAAKDELAVLERLARKLNLDPKKIEAMRDKRLTNIEIEAHGEEGASHVLGIKPEWSKSEVKKHLRTEYAKWNNRLNTLPEGSKREKAQQMLDLIGRERTKYD